LADWLKGNKSGAYHYSNQKNKDSHSTDQKVLGAEVEEKLRAIKGFMNLSAVLIGIF